MVRLFSTLALLLALAPSAPGQEATAPEVVPTTDRWYEILRRGQKVGYTRVTWAPSTWKGKKTLHDTTTVVRRTVRNMAGIMDEFETSYVVDLERGTDGTLWWMRSTFTDKLKQSKGDFAVLFAYLR